MTKEELSEIHRKLNELYDNLYIARRTNDKRSLGKNVREAEARIISYANSIPPELRAKFDKEIVPMPYMGNTLTTCLNVSS